MLGLSSLRPLKEGRHKSSTVLVIFLLMLKICLDTTAVGSTEHASEKERNQIFAHAGKRVSQQLSGNINQNSTMSNIVMSLASSMAFTRNFT